MIDMLEHSVKISLKEEVGLIETIQETFSLQKVPRIALVNDLTTKLGKFRDVVAYSGIPYFIRINRETGMTIVSRQEENHIHIDYPLSIENQGDLYGFLVETQKFADRELEIQKKIGKNNFKRIVFNDRDLNELYLEKE